jgi:hypothetical protein
MRPGLTAGALGPSIVSLNTKRRFRFNDTIEGPRAPAVPIVPVGGGPIVPVDGGAIEVSLS